MFVIFLFSGNEEHRV